MIGMLEYEKARKKGLKQINFNRSNGWDTTLLALDRLISRESVLSEVRLGRGEIQLKKIKGTKTMGRQRAFAPDYMPILKVETEFANKWAALYEAQIEEGIRDPIKVYEYLNWYYVGEGNKRVSVLKHNNATLIYADVIRLIPKYDEGDLNIVLYYEFLIFYEKTKISYIWFSHKGSFSKMYKWINKYGWNNEEQIGELRMIYYRFRKAYKKLGGDNLTITTGDAFLKYLDIYSCDLEGLKSLEKNLGKLWREMKGSEGKNRINIKLTDKEIERKTLLSSLSNLSNKQIKIAFIHAKNTIDSTWTYAHEIGRKYIEDIFGETIVTTSVYDVPEDEHAYDRIREVAEDGYEVIFVTSPAFINITLKVALEYQTVKFLNCSENMSYKHLRTYFGRIYEPNFLAGMIAGAMSKNNKLGYIVTYPIPEVISSINAYTLGARFMNPYIEVYIKWVENNKDTKKSKHYGVDNQLEDVGVDIICHQESGDLQSKANNLGVYFTKDLSNNKKSKYLAKPIWRWGIFYEKILRSVMEGNYARTSGFLGIKGRAINYWWGMEAGVVDLVYSQTQVPEPLRRSVNMLKKMIIEGTYHPFMGPIKDQEGIERVEINHTMSNEGILEMDWFVQGVIGSIPSLDMEKDNHPLVELFGVKKK